MYYFYECLFFFSSSVSISVAVVGVAVLLETTKSENMYQKKIYHRLYNWSAFFFKSCHNCRINGIHTHTAMPCYVCTQLQWNISPHLIRMTNSTECANCVHFNANCHLSVNKIEMNVPRNGIPQPARPTLEATN